MKSEKFLNVKQIIEKFSHGKKNKGSFHLKILRFSLAFFSHVVINMREENPTQTLFA